ncbi:MAG: glycosyltransferase [Ktedonobacterales bacterium]
MRIVFVTTQPPSRLHPRSFGYVTSLAERHNVTVVCLCHTPRDITDVGLLRGQGVHVTPVFEESHAALTRAAGALFSERSLKVAYAASPRLRAAVFTEIARGDVGVVHVEHLLAAGATLDLPVPTVWDAVGCASLLSRLSGDLSPQVKVRGFARVETQRIREYERDLLRAYRHVTVASQRDQIALIGSELPLPSEAEEREGTSAESLAELAPLGATAALPAARPLASVRVLPSGVDLDYFRPMAPRRHPNRLVFTGRLNSPANVAALDTLLTEVMPRIWRVREDVRLTIAGARPPRQARSYTHDPRVTVTGYAPDLRPYLAGASVAVCPHPFAVGTLDSILEAMAMGTPVVTDDAAMGGLSAIPGRDVLVAGTADRFAQQTLRLLEDDALWYALSLQGRAYVERRHALPVVREQLEALYREVSDINYTLPTTGSFAAALRLARLAGV